MRLKWEHILAVVTFLSLIWVPLLSPPGDRLLISGSLLFGVVTITLVFILLGLFPARQHRLSLSLLLLVWSCMSLPPLVGMCAEPVGRNRFGRGARAEPRSDQRISEDVSFRPTRRANGH
jgi:hypothetical protein